MSAKKTKSVSGPDLKHTVSDEEPEESQTQSMLTLTLDRLREVVCFINTKADYSAHFTREPYRRRSSQMESLEEYKAKIENKRKHRINLFAQIMTKTLDAEEKEAKKILLQRLLLIARLPNGLRDRTELAAHYEKLSLQLSKQFPWDNMTGLLLLYPSCLIHVIESSRDVLVTILVDLAELQQTSDSVSLEAPKIVFMAHNPHSRQFQQWSYKLLNTDLDPAEGTKELLKEPTETLVLQVLSSVKTVAKGLEQAKRTEGGSALKDLGMSPDVLISLTSREDLQTPQQYLKSYNSHLHISMDFTQVKRSSCLTTI